MRQAQPFDSDSQVARRLVAALALVAAVVVVTAPTWHRGLGWCFRGSDPRYFLEVARAPFGRGEAFRRIGFSYESSYRYGRIGYSLLGWVLALGHPPSLMF